MPFMLAVCKLDGKVAEGIALRRTMEPRVMVPAPGS